MKELLQQALNETGGFITHTDLDGILSAAYLYHKTRKPLTGICNLSNSGTTKLRTTASCEELPHQLFIDLSIVDNSWSIDHHYLPLDYLPHKSINANKYYGSECLSEKNPTGNILWLMFLFEEQLELYTKEQLQVLASADSFYDNYSQYKSNVDAWACLLNLEPLLLAIEGNNKHAYYNQLTLDKISFLTKGQIKWYKNQYYFTYNSTRGEERITLQDIFTKVAAFFGWETLIVPTFDNTFVYNNYQAAALPKKLNDNVTFAAQKYNNLYFYSKFRGFEC